MACRYYDDLITAKIKRWVDPNSNLRVLKPEETKRFFEATADDKKDQAFTLPLIMISRNNDINLDLNIKNHKSFNGLSMYVDQDKTVQINVIPIKISYQIDIYTKTYNEGDEYIRNYLFKLINNPKLVIEVPYNDSYYRHVAYIRVLPTISDTSSVSERIFPGQFTKWTIQIELTDTFLFSIPYRKNWKLWIDDIEILDQKDMDVLDDPVELAEEKLVAAEPINIFCPIDQPEEQSEEETDNE